MNTERFEDYYETLGVSRNATIEEIKQAKRVLSKKYHPDLTLDETLKDINGNILAKINNAADVLLNPQKKYEYDLEWDAHKMKQEQDRQRRRRPYYEQAGAQYTQGSTQRQGYERHFYDYETNQTYTSYEQYEQQSQQRARQEQSTRQSTRTEQTRRAKGYTSKHAKKGFFEDIKQAAREVREDEKRRKTSARRAHANVNNFVNRKFSKNRNIAEEILCAISKGTLHICVSTLRELSKLGYIAKDSFPKFVIRNRRVAAMGAAAVILFSSFGIANDKDVVIPETPSITISDSTLSNDQNKDQVIIGDTTITDPLEGVFQEEEKVTEYVAKRYHKVVAGDTLSGLAELAGCSIETIQRENYITGSLIKIGETLVIPYEFTSEDYKYATTEVHVPTGKTLREIAQEYHTDVATIIRLNEDNVIQSQGNYYVITDTVRVPNFATPSQIKEAREADLAYSKRQ